MWKFFLKKNLDIILFCIKRVRDLIKKLEDDKKKEEKLKKKEQVKKNPQNPTNKIVEKEKGKN